MATKMAQRRLQKEYLGIQKSPPPFIWACPEENNILNWHFILRGPPDSVYAGGEYHGLIWFPNDYPFKPPDIKMFTPSGRFEVGQKICMSMTSYHPTTWNAAWSVATILTGLLSFMLSDEITAGAVRTTEAEKKAMATASHGYNISSKKFRDMFPAYAGPSMTDLPDMGNGPTNSAPQATKLSDLASTTNDSTPASSTIPTPSRTPVPPDSTPKPPVPAAAAAAAAAPPQPIANQGGSWMSWRLVAVVAVLAVLGRLSTYAGRA